MRRQFVNMRKLRVHFILTLMSVVLVDVQGQNDGQTSDGPTGPRAVNLFVINEETNDVANRSVNNALKSIRDNHMGWLGETIIIQINGSDPRDALERICTAWDRAVRDGGRGVPDLVLDVTRSGFGAETVNSFTSAVGVPTLSAQFGQYGDLRHWRDLTQDQKKYLIQVLPPADLVPEAIRQLAITMNITNAAIMFDQNFVMDHKYKSLLLNVPTRHVIVRAKEFPAIDAQLSQLRDLDIVNFFVLAKEEVLTAILDAAEAKNFTGRKYGWYSLSLEEFTPKCDCKNLSVLFFQPQSTSSSQQQLGGLTSKGLLQPPLITAAFYYDVTRLAVQAMRDATVNNQWPMEPRHITCDEFNGNNTPTRNFDFLEKLRNVTTDGKFEPTYASFHWGTQNGDHMANFTMKISLIVIDDGNAISTNAIGEWPAGIDSPLQISPSKTEIVQNHTAVKSFRVVTVITPPFVMYDPETDEWSGYCIDLLDNIRNILHFEYEIREVADGEFGSMTPDGTWNGMVGELKDKRADIALGTISVMAERENVVDFTVPYYDLVGISILMRKQKAATSLFKFLTVLENDVWLCILASYFFTSFLMWLFDRWSPYSYQNNREKYKDDEEKREFSLKECLWFCMTSLTPQGGGEAPKNLSGRLVAATWWLFGFIIIASYTANLAAFLTVSRLETPVESLDGLSKQYKIQYAPVRPSEAYTYFDRMAKIETRFYEIWKDMSLNDSLSDAERAELAVWDYPVSDKYTKMFQAMKEAGFPKSKEEAVQRVRRELQNSSQTDFAFIGDATDIRYLEMTNCDLIMVGEEFSRKPYAIAVQQGSPLKDQFNNAILHLLNKRILEQLKNKWWAKNPAKKTCEKEDDQSEGISIQNIGGVFIVIFVGIALACITLAFEYWWYRHRPKKLEQKRMAAAKKSSHMPNPIRLTLEPARAPQFPDVRSRF
ncbi:ionotropic receptor 25a [Diachasmimorpha longicaudata]|uniref:ionotropic receptor 25a n=1 Tax=Diachasmimorpha longicaudata TaxID=58733 RepID=UPI0030B890B3